MREILFRARTISEDEYMDSGEWVEGFYTCFNGDEHRIYTGYSETDCGDHYPDWFNVLPETVGQFTGLTDKNGKKIFEGDIVSTKYKLGRGHYYVFEVYYNENLCHFALTINRGSYTKNKQYDWLQLTSLKANKIEVIGNIHDNPELLKGNVE